MSKAKAILGGARVKNPWGHSKPLFMDKNQFWVFGTDDVVPGQANLWRMFARNELELLDPDQEQFTGPTCKWCQPQGHLGIDCSKRGRFYQGKRTDPDQDQDAELERLRAENAELKARNEALENTAELYEESLARVMGERGQWCDENAELRRRLKSESREYECEISNLQDNLEDIWTTLGEAHEPQQDPQQAVQRLVGERDQLRAELERVKAERDDLKLRLRLRRLELQVLDPEPSDSEVEASLFGRVVCAETGISEACQGVAQLKQRVAELERIMLSHVHEVDIGQPGEPPLIIPSRPARVFDKNRLVKPDEESPADRSR